VILIHNAVRGGATEVLGVSKRILKCRIKGITGWEQGGTYTVCRESAAPIDVGSDPLRRLCPNILPSSHKNGMVRNRTVNRIEYQRRE